MTFHRMRNTWATGVLGFITAVVLASCGGGGASTTQGGTLLIQPAAATVYGGVPFTMQFSGGKTPYRLSSSEPALLGLPATTSASSLTVLPANPGVVDAGLQPGELQVRTVTVTMTDQTGQSATASIKVGQNFLTGYGISFSSTSCTSSGSTTTTTALICAGGDTVLRMAAVTNGNLYGAREFRFDVVQGNYTLVNPDTGASGPSIGVTSDHAGGLTAIVRVAANAPTQVGVLRVTDVATQVSTLETFTITGAATNGALTIIPNDFTFVGATSASCGTGSGDFLVFDGVPPFTAISTDPNIQVTPVDATHTPGRFRITAGNSGVCSSKATIVVIDSANNRGTVTVTTQAGTVAPVIPPQPLSVQPNTITLGCGQTGSVTVVGGGSGSTGSGSGSGSTAVTYSVSSTSPNVGATVTGNTVSITRGGPAGPGTGSSNTIVNVTDGSSVVPITVTSPTTCP